MLALSYAELYQALSDPDLVEPATRNAVAALDLKTIVVDDSQNETYGGDDMVILATEILEAQMLGYQIATWYGPEAEVLIIGYRQGQLVFEEDEDS